ncbi:dehydrogenase [Nocardia panacis]|uniref:Dehydrogenase n=1 Tax=Nocardia panacis TaxID=2340916 RepID=A0A3A4KCW9_9NOCA|nr:alcohol dehydrogenase catalytic domain-containing protein [Nocardia panacis]RJO70675.1 dehydrogenase [Nocardia panacis]
MRSLWFVEPGRTEWREVPTPALENDGQALVTPVVAGRCPFDVPVLSGATPLRGDFAFGHEAVGKVVAIGDAVAGVRPGDLVVVPPEICCGECGRCLRGWTAHCEAVPHGATYGLAVAGDWGGLFDDVVRVPYADAMLIRVPPELDPYECVAVGDTVGVAHDLAVRYVRGEGRTRVLMLSHGSTGLLVVACAFVHGADYVVYVDRNAENRALAANLGAVALSEPPDLAAGWFDLVVDASAGNVEWLRRGIELSAPEARVQSLGGIFGATTVPAYEMYVQGVTLRIARANNVPNIGPALDSIAAGLVTPSLFYSDIVAWNDLPEAILEPGRKIVSRHDDQA